MTQRILVTAGAAGIGRAIAEAFLADGADVAICDVDSDQLAAMQEAYPRCCQTNENSHQIAGAALIYALNSWRHSVRAAARFSLKLSRE